MANGNGSSIPIILHYKAGQIYSQNKVNKWGKGWASFVKDIAWRTWNDSPRSSGFGGSSTWVDGRYFAETEARGLGMERNTSGLKLSGSYIYPYIMSNSQGTAHTGKSGYIIASKGRETVSSSDIISVTDCKWVVDTEGISKHYLLKHCYQRFLAYEEELAQYWGVKPISPTEWGARWDFNVLSHVAWRLLITWDTSNIPVLLWYDGLVNNDLQEPDMSMATVEIAKTLGKMVFVAATAGVGAAAAGMNLGLAQAGKTMGVANATMKGIEMSQNKYANSGKPFGWKDKDTLRVYNAWLEGEEKVGAAQKKFDEAQKKYDKEWGEAKDFRAPRLFSGGKVKYQGGINDWLTNTAPFKPLKIELRSSRSYENRWRMKMNSRILNRYFNFDGDEELQMKPGYGMERGKFREVMINIHGWTKFSGRNFFGISENNPLFKLWCNEDIHVYQRNEWRPEVNFSKDLYEGYTKNIDFIIADQKGSTDISEYTSRERHVEVNKKKVSATFVFFLIWVSDENRCVSFKRKGVFSTFSAISGKAPGQRGGVEIVGSEIQEAYSYLEDNLKNTVLRKSDHCPASQCRVSGRIGDPECAWEATRWKGGTTPEEKEWTKPWTEENIAPYRGKEYRVLRWGKSKSGKLAFGGGRECNTIVARFLRGIPDEEIIHTKPDEAEWVLERDQEIGGICLGWKKTTSTDVQYTISRSTNVLNIKYTTQVQGISGLEGWGNMPPDTFGGGNDNAGAGIASPDAFQTLVAQGGTMIPDTNPLGIQQQMAQGEMRPDFAWDNIPQDFKVDIPTMSMERLSQATWERTTNRETNRQREDINASMNKVRNERKKEGVKG
jgi:hypothetical protein